MNTRDTRLLQAELIETIRIEADGRIPLWPGHCARLQASARALGRPVTPETLETARMHALAMRPDDGPARWRLLLTPDGELRSETAPLPDTPVPVAVRLADDLLESSWSWLRHKTTWRPLYQQAGQWLAVHPDVFDLVFLNERGQVCEGSRSNVYVRNAHGHWLTPPLSSGLLPGVCRQALLDSGQVLEAVLTRHDLETATALRVSNALRGWLDARLGKVPDTGTTENT